MLFLFSLSPLVSNTNNFTNFTKFILHSWLYSGLREENTKIFLFLEGFLVKFITDKKNIECSWATVASWARPFRGNSRWCSHVGTTHNKYYISTSTAVHQPDITSWFTRAISKCFHHRRLSNWCLFISRKFQ